jgi:hypothetical protein
MRYILITKKKEDNYKMTLIIEGRTEDLQWTWRERLLSLDLSIVKYCCLVCMSRVQVMLEVFFWSYFKNNVVFKIIIEQ